MIKTRTSWNWIAALLWLFCATRASAQETIEITTSDPVQVNAETNAYVSSLLSRTPSDEPVIFRVDQLTDALVEYANSNIASGQDRIKFVMSGLRVTDIFDDVIYDVDKGSDVSLFVAALLGLLPGDYGIEPHPNFLESHGAALQAQNTRNFTLEILQAHDDVMDFLGGTGSINTSAPLYQLSYGYERATGSKTVGYFDIDNVSRCFVWLNLGATGMLQPEIFRSAAVHETWHCIQFKEIAHNGSSGTQKRNLLHTSLIEGFATYLTMLVNPDLSETELLFWTNEDLAAANERSTEIIQAFEKDRNEIDHQGLREWYYIDIPLSSVPGAPPRSGYYVAYLAMQAYADQLDEEIRSNRGDLVSHLLEVTGDAEGREDIFQALLRKQDLGTSGTVVLSSPLLSLFLLATLASWA